MREIFGIGPSGYKMCDVVSNAHISEGYLLVRDPDTGHEYVATPGMGTWCALKPYDALYKIKWLEARVKELETFLNG